MEFTTQTEPPAYIFLRGSENIPLPRGVARCSWDAAGKRPHEPPPTPTQRSRQASSSFPPIRSKQLTVSIASVPGKNWNPEAPSSRHSPLACAGSGRPSRRQPACSALAAGGPEGRGAGGAPGALAPPA